MTVKQESRTYYAGGYEVTETYQVITFENGHTFVEVLDIDAIPLVVEYPECW